MHSGQRRGRELEHPVSSAFGAVQIGAAPWLPVESGGLFLFGYHLPSLVGFGERCSRMVSSPTVGFGKPSPQHDSSPWPSLSVLT